MPVDVLISSGPTGAGHT